VHQTTGGHRLSAQAIQAQRSAMRISLVIGVLMFLGKGLAWLLTGSAAILSDAAESVVHVAAVAFAAFSLRLSQQPPDREHPYGHEKVGFLSAGFEGALIAIAAIFIISESIQKLIEGPRIDNLSLGTLIVAGAAIVNGLLGWHLIRTGRKENSVVLVANGKHVLTDCITSAGVVVALLLVAVTRWTPLDPILAIAVALQILGSGFGLVKESAQGLMDRRDPALDAQLRAVLDDWMARTDGTYHGLRHRKASHMIWVDLHLILPGSWPLERAHAEATALETSLALAFPENHLEITSHLEPLDEHERDHPEGGYLHR
jgi:cation diffusion facilitator family transporter